MKCTGGTILQLQAGSEKKCWTSDVFHWTCTFWTLRLTIPNSPITYNLSNFITSCRSLDDKIIEVLLYYVVENCLLCWFFSSYVHVLRLGYVAFSFRCFGILILNSFILIMIFCFAICGEFDNSFEIIFLLLIFCCLNLSKVYNFKLYIFVHINFWKDTFGIKYKSKHTIWFSLFQNILGFFITIKKKVLK